MNIVKKIKSLFQRGVYTMTTSSLNSILDHPKIPISKQEYERILENLHFFKSDYPDVEYVNSSNEVKKRPFFHLPIGKTTSRKIASLIYNENAEITSENEVVNEFLQSVLNNDRFNKNFERYLESCLALGGMAMRPYVDNNRIRVAFIQAPVFFPLQSNTQDVSSAAIVSKSTKSEGREVVYFTLIEFHEWIPTGDGDSIYRVTNELYRSKDKNQVGARVPLSELYEDMEETVQIKGLTRPLFTYLKPAGMNNKDINSPLGLSIYDNAKPTIDFINRTFDEFMWEVKMGQRRVIVPEQLTDVIMKQNQHGDLIPRRRFDVENNVFMQLGGIGSLDSNPIIDITTPIRTEDYSKAISEGLKLYEMQIGVSAGMFTFDGTGVKTATEIVSEQSDTYQMRNSIVNLVEFAIKELAISICELGKLSNLYNGPIPELDEISVNLDDGVFTDRNAELEYWTKAYASNLTSQRRAISKTMGVTLDEADDIIREINSEVETPTDAEMMYFQNTQENGNNKE